MQILLAKKIEVIDNFTRENANYWQRKFKSPITLLWKTQLIDKLTTSNANHWQGKCKTSITLLYKMQTIGKKKFKSSITLL